MTYMSETEMMMLIDQLDLDSMTEEALIEKEDSTEEYKEPLFDIRVAEDRLSVTFQLLEPAKENQTSPGAALLLDEVLAILEQRGIKVEMDRKAIEQELALPCYEPVVIAKGQAPVPGKDATVEILFADQVSSQFFEVNGTVDYKNHLHIPSVTKGEVIARKIPMQEGVPGYDVYGEVIAPEPPRDVTLVGKPNVEITEDGEVIALKDGRPRILGTSVKIFDISTSFVVTGDVDLKTGNIVFCGDVIVYGDVTDHMKVESLGNVYVYGNVYNATITATGSIYIRGNAIGSNLYSGYYGVLFNRLYHRSKHLSLRMDDLLKACKMLNQALAARKQSVKFGYMVNLLIENKFRDITSVARELLAVILNLNRIHKEEFIQLKEMTALLLNPTKLLEEVTVFWIQRYTRLLDEAQEEVARMQEEKVKISVNQCNMSELKSNGDIIIYREGVVLSDLYSSGNITFKDEYALCRGSRLEAAGTITAMTVGGKTGAETLLKAQCAVRVKLMYAGRVCVGRTCIDISEPIHDVILDKAAIEQYVV